MKMWLIRCPQAGFARCDFAHQLVGVQAAFHQELAFGFADQFDRLDRGCLAVGHIDDLDTADIEPVLARQAGNLRGWPDQDRHDDASVGGFERPAQRRLLAGIGNDGSRGWHGLGPRDQAVVFGFRWRSRRRDSLHLWLTLFLQWHFWLRYRRSVFYDATI